MKEELKRNLSLLDVAAIGINGIVGTGIFFLPGKVAAQMGPASLFCFIIAAILCTLLVLSFAEVGSRFEKTGGPLLYSQTAFGNFVGFGVGWLSALISIIAFAALSNAFVNALNAVIPGSTEFKTPLITALFIIFGIMNIRGVSMGSKVINFFTIAKLIPLGIFIIWGLFTIKVENFSSFSPMGYGNLSSATLLLIYAFVGFEVLPVVAGEVENPKKNVPKALVLVISLVTVIYIAIWAVCFGNNTGLAGSDNPVAETAKIFMGANGGVFIAIGILFSVVGVNAGQALVGPRAMFALSEEGYFPKFFSKINGKTGTPIVAIVTVYTMSYIFALTGSFIELAVISVLARFLKYIITCLALPVLRKKMKDDEKTFKLPFGFTIPLLAAGLCVWLMTESDPNKLIKGVIALVLGYVIYIPYRFFQKKSQTAVTET